jgi:uncharacterized protein YceK
MMRHYVLFFAALVILLSGCASSVTKDIQVDAQAEPKANFNGYRTYAWLGSAAIINDPYGEWEPPSFDADAEIKFLLDRELRKRGMTENTSDPDLVVAFAAGIDMAALGLKEDPDSKEDVLTSIPQGGLLVAFVDNDSGFVIWAGVATGNVHDKPDAQTVKKRLDYAVTQLIKQVPK